MNSEKFENASATFGSNQNSPEQNHSEDFGTVRNDSEPFRTVPQPSEAFGNVPHDSEDFGRIRKHAEEFRTFRQPAARKEGHTLTVREVARMFEAANVARSERSITNWCQPNRQGIARLDAYYDSNERRYYITALSVEAAIQEEIAKAARMGSESLPKDAEDFGSAEPDDLKDAKNGRRAFENINPEIAEGDLEEIHRENIDLKITNRAKDMFIEQMKQERDEILKNLVESSRHIGELQTKLLGISGGKEK